jgi:hypothetical protein
MRVFDGQNQFRAGSRRFGLDGGVINLFAVGADGKYRVEGAIHVKIEAQRVLKFASISTRRPLLGGCFKRERSATNLGLQ